MTHLRPTLGRYGAGAIIALALLAASLAVPAAATPSFPQVWPAPAAIDGMAVTFPSHSPFGLVDIGGGPEVDPPTEAQGTLFLPDGASAADPVPAVVLLHGAGGVSRSREMTYGQQFADMGVAALVVDSFAARRDLATGFVQRVLNITETMMLADAYAALDWLADRPEIDADRVVLIGFSYGGMVSVLAAYEQVAELLAPEGRRFAGHISFYGPCIARFEDPRATGAPVLMMLGGEDRITRPERCREILDDLHAGGSPTELVVFEGAYHQWDGGFGTPRLIGRGLAECRLWVDRDGAVRDRRTLLTMTGPVSRRLILGLCSDGEGYMIGRNDDMRERSNAEMARFLAGVFSEEFSVRADG